MARLHADQLLAEMRKRMLVASVTGKAPPELCLYFYAITGSMPERRNARNQWLKHASRQSGVKPWRCAVRIADLLQHYRAEPRRVGEALAGRDQFDLAVAEAFAVDPSLPATDRQIFRIITRRHSGMAMSVKGAGLSGP